MTMGNRTVLSAQSLPSNSTGGTDFTFDLAGLEAQVDAFEMVCTAMAAGSSASYAFATTFAFFPTNPYGGSVVKMDQRTGGILAPTTSGDAWEPFLPLGFFTTFTGYLDSNLTALDDLKASG